MAMSATTAAAADCELLGRGPVQGSADSDGLAALVRQLCKQQQRGRLPGRRCTVTCSRDAGLEIVPHQPRKRPDDEGFESDEDLASLGSYEDPNKRKTGGGGGGGGSVVGALAAASAAAGAGSDSANSSGVSEDSDDADAASLREQSAADPSGSVGGGVGGGGGVGRETYGLADVAFCHTDAAALPGIAVWVIKTRRTSAAGLEAIVVRSRGDDHGLQDVCRAYQEHSRRLKLEPKPWANGQANGSSSSQRRKIVGGVAVTLTAAPEVNRYNLVQRTDTDGVTHIEVTAGPVAAADRNAGGRDDHPPSSIISLSTPESPRPAAKDMRGVYADESREQQQQQQPPQRPERRKYKQAKPETAEDFRRQQKVVRGQFIRVNVNHCAALPPDSPEPEKKQPAAAAPPSQHESSGKSTLTTASTGAAGSDRLWSTADYDRLDGRYDQHRRSSRSGSRTRSRSTGPARRQHELSAAVQTQPPPQPPPQQQQYPQPPVAFSRYPNVEQQQPLSTFGTRFFGKLREITTGNQYQPQDLQPVTFRRRNSVGESVTANFYQYFGHQHHHHHHQHNQYQQQHYHHQHHLQQQQQQQQQRQQVKNGGNLKSVIKKNKSQPYQHAYDEPKKVTFSAYATVQVVD